MSETAYPSPKSLKQHAYEVLKRKIVTCEMLPGTFFTEDMLCEELNASRTPVRDAIGRLEQEHLVSIKPKKGILINRVSINNIHELFEMRLLLAPEVVLRYGNRINDEIYAQYLHQFMRTDCCRDELYHLDDTFHQMFVTASDNRYIESVYNIIRDQVTRYRVLSAAEDRMESTQQEHYDITANCLRGAWKKAAEAMRVHIENSKLSIIHYVLETNRSAKNVFIEVNE